MPKKLLKYGFRRNLERFSPENGCTDFDYFLSWFCYDGLLGTSKPFRNNIAFFQKPALQQFWTFTFNWDTETLETFSFYRTNKKAIATRINAYVYINLHIRTVFNEPPKHFLGSGSVLVFLRKFTNQRIDKKIDVLNIRSHINKFLKVYLYWTRYRKQSSTSMLNREGTTFTMKVLLKIWFYKKRSSQQPSFTFGVFSLQYYNF